MAGQTTMEFVVAHDKSHFVREKVERITQLFGVRVSFSSPQSSAESTGVQWIRLQGIKESNEKAKEYIMSLCSPDLDTVVSFPDSVQSILYNSLNKLEYDSGAVITVVSDRNVRIRGSQMAVVMASSAIDDLKSRPTLDIDPALKEFAMKLGYTEQDIQVVVKKHGPMVNENTLLHGLIKISRTTPLPSTRGATRQPVAEPDKFPISKGSSPKHRDVVARGAPNSTTSVSVNTMIVNGDRVSYATPVSPTVRKDTVDKAPLDKHEEQIMYQQMFGGKDASKSGDSSSGLRHIVIDGSNVAMSHGNQEVFSCFGIALCVAWFKQRGHRQITVFVPQWRKETPRPDSPMTDQEILSDLEKERIVVFTPSRRVNGRRIVCYDDRFIVRLAADHDGIIVSNDNYRDLVNENPKWKEVIEQRLLMFSFVNDIFMVPDDPLGRHGPTLDDFLRKGTIAHPRVCPYLGKCTFGLKCRYYHPERDPARKQESGKASDTVVNRTVAQPSYDSRRKETVSVTDRQPYRPHDGTSYAGQDVRGDRTFVAGGVFDRQQQPTPYHDYYHQDFTRQPMLPVNGVRHHPYVDPFYVPVRQMSSYSQPQGLVREQLNGSGVDPNRQRQSGMSTSHFHDEFDAPWDKDKQDLFEQLKRIYSQSEQEDVIRHVVQNSHGKDFETLAGELADQV